jgi:hypothetical protein
MQCCLSAEPEVFDSHGKPLNNAAVRQVQRAKQSERKRKRTTIWIAIAMVALVAIFSCIMATLIWWRRRAAEKEESFGPYSYHNPTADLNERYFSGQHSSDDFGSAPATGEMVPVSARSKGSPITVYDNSYLNYNGKTVRFSNSLLMHYNFMHLMFTSLDSDQGSGSIVCSLQ